MTISEDVQAIAKEIQYVSSLKHTGEMNITINMSQGSIGQIHVNIGKNLKGNSSKRPKNAHY